MLQNTLLPLILGFLMFSFFITGLLVIPYINLLYKLKLTRRKSESKEGKRSIFAELHKSKVGTPVGGGILLIFIVTLLFAGIFPLASRMGVYIRSAFDFKIELFVIFFTFISFGVLGFMDDYIKIFGSGKSDRPLSKTFGLTRKTKFIIQWILALIISYILYSRLGIQILHIPLVNYTLNLGVAYIPFAAFIIVFFCNAFNITDGLDGLSVGLLVICLLAFGIISASTLDTPLSVFISLWLGSLMAFLYFNVWPARIFLGDAGTLSFGAMLAVIGLLTGSVMPLFIIGGIFVVEIVSSTIQILGWKFLNKPILPVAPLHHTLEFIGWEEPKIVMRAWLAGIMLSIFGLWLASI